MRGKGKLEFVTFDLASPKDVLEKFHREVERFEQAPDREHAGDHVINAFTTGWHLHEWVWDAIRDKPTMSAAVFSKLGLVGSIEKAQHFGAELARKYPFLEICRIVATSAKHVHVALEKDSPQNVEARFSSTSSSGTYPFGTRPYSTRGPRWVAKIMVGTETMPVVTVLHQVDAFWVDMIYGCAIEART